MTRLTTCFASAALLIVLGSTAQAEPHRIAPSPHNSGYATTPRFGFNGQIGYGRGMYFNYVQPGSPAYWMGLGRGGVTARINGWRTNSRYEYNRALGRGAYARGGRVAPRFGNVWARNPYFAGSHASNSSWVH